MGTETGYFATLGLSAGSLSTRSKSSSAAMRLIQIAQSCRAPPHLTQAHTELYRRAANLALTVKHRGISLTVSSRGLGAALRGAPGEGGAAGRGMGGIQEWR